MERDFQLLAAIHLAVVGLSHMLAPLAWTELFLRLREKGEAGILIVGGLSLAFGSLVVVFHPVWSGLPLILTLYGWSQLLKGALYCIAPRFGMRQLQRVSRERASLFRVPGAFLLVVSLLLLWHLSASVP